jgi:C_GCAxxG_C_C family probable redox protein
MEARNRHSVENQIQQLMESGLNCAEAVLHTFLDEGKTNPSPGSFTRFGSGLMGGIGGTHTATCGALLGCILVLGQLYGRDNAGEHNQEIKTLAAELLFQFEEKYGTIHCGSILEKMDQGEITESCQVLTGKAASDLSLVLIKNKHRR